jgi:uncharacterized protein YbaP (TraB family)
MKILKCLLVLFFSVVSVGSFSQNNKIASSIGWQITGAKSSIVLLGELHVFELNNTQVLDHSLVQDAYTLSDYFWIENPSSVNGPVAIARNSSKLSTTTWNVVNAKVKEVVEILLPQRSDIEKNAIVLDTIRKIDELNPLDAVALLGQLAVPIYRKTKKGRITFTDGFTRTLLEKSKNLQDKRIKFIEDADSAAKHWANRCNTTSDTESIFLAALKYFEIEMYATNSSQILTHRFAELNEEKNDTSMHLPRPQAEMEVWHKCNVLPRNREWLPKLIDALNSEQEKHVFLFGIGHILGDEGLLAMLRTAGYREIRRIYKIER